MLFITGFTLTKRAYILLAKSLIMLKDLIDTKNWSNTALGNADFWPESLKLAISISLNSGFPIAIYWGSDFTLLYNDAWSSIPGDKHPWALGKPGAEVWPEIWEGLQPEFESVLYTGESIRRPDALLLMNRFGYIEECYFDYTLSPIKANDGKIGGVFNAVIETTYKYITERRKKLLHSLLLANLSRGISESLPNIKEMLEEAKDDITFFQLFIDFKTDGFNVSGNKDRPKLVLSGGNNHPELLNHLWPVPDSDNHYSSIQIDNLPEIVELSVMSHFGEPCQQALIVPLSAHDSQLNGYLVLGASPRKRLDEEYRHFLESVGLHIGTILHNAYAFEKEGRFEREQALNEELAAANEELSSTNDELQQVQESLQDLNEDLERRVTYRTKALVESEARLQGMIMTSPIGIAVLKGRNLIIEMANQPMLAIWSRSRDEVIGRGLVEVFPEQNGQPFLKMLADVFESGRSISIAEIEVIIGTSNGEKKVYVDFQYAPLYDSERNIEAVMASVTDITPIVEARKRLEESEQELQSLNEELVATNEELAVSVEELAISEKKKDEFISIASHELKTPLTSIKAFNQLMQRTQDEQRLKGFISKSAESVHRLEMLINDLLDVTKINAGKMIYAMEPFDFSKMVAESVENAQHISRTHDIVLESNEHIEYTGDQLRLEQVLHNFLSNAVKYSPDGGRVIVNSKVELNNLVVSVQDFGIGIEEKNLDQLFDRYYRVDNTSMRFEGLGLGLYISSEILKRHEGSFWIESVPGSGATFFFRLPLHPEKQIVPKVQTDTFYQDEYITINYQKNKMRLDVDWIGYQNLESVQNGGMAMLEILQKNNCTKVLNDNTNVLGSWSEAADWAGSVWFPMMERAGLTHFAWVYSASMFSRLAAEKSVDIAVGNVTTQFFTDLAAAEEWLNGR
jgi:PAS domain S-box-containing protein